MNRITEDLIYYLLDFWFVAFLCSMIGAYRISGLDYIELEARVIAIGIWMFCALYSLSNTKLNKSRKIKLC